MRVMLDTCVLYPAVLRDFLLALAARGLFTPLWSDGVTAEWLHLVASRNPTERADVAILLRRMSARWPKGLVPAGTPGLLDLPDADDKHVLAAAIAGHADMILTHNWRDFPRPKLAPFGLDVMTPNDFTIRLWLNAAPIVEEVVAANWPGLAGSDLRRALRRAGLPRLGKALAI